MIEEVEKTGDPQGRRGSSTARKVMASAPGVPRRRPRARVLRRTCRELAAPRYEAANALEQALSSSCASAVRRPIETNVEFWAAVILDFADVPPT